MSKDKLLAFVLISLSLIGIVLSFIPSENTKSSKSGGELSSVVKGLPGGDKILTLTLEGVMMDGNMQSLLGGESSGAVKVRDQLLKAAKDKSVKGVLLRINSPGGSVGISQEIYEAVKKVRLKKPIIASMGDVAASGGYYVASACDYIISNPGTLTGSIGVISHFTNLEGLYGKFGVKDMTVKAGKYKDIGSSTRGMTDEEHEILQELVNDTYDQFINDVYEGRRTNDASKYGQLRKNLTRDEIRELAQGMIYTGRQAKEVGLVDKLGNYSDSLEELQKLVKKKSNGKIKEDLLVVDSLSGTSSLRELIGISSLLNDGRLKSLLLGQPNTVSESIGKQLPLKMTSPVMLLAPEFVSAI